VFAGQWFPQHWFEEHWFAKDGDQRRGGSSQVPAWLARLLHAEAYAQANENWRALEARREQQLVARLVAHKRLELAQRIHEQRKLAAAAYTIMFAEA
jgi:hypothetical protein